MQPNRQQRESFSEDGTEMTKKAIIVLEVLSSGRQNVAGTRNQKLKSSRNTSSSCTTVERGPTSPHHTENGDQDTWRRGKTVSSPVPPDQTLTKDKCNIMKKKRTIGRCDVVEEYYETIWSDDTKKEDDNNQFYKNWLEASGKYDIVVQPWEEQQQHLPMIIIIMVVVHREDEEDGTRTLLNMSQQRQVDFTFTRTTHLYTGPPVAKVRQIHKKNNNNDVLYKYI